MLIGITGCIGSGKSFTLSLFNKLGYETYDCDKFVQMAYLDKTIQEKLDDEFSCLINGKIDKQIIIDTLITSPKKLEILNKIIHPFVKDEILKINHHDKLVFVEVPLLFETDFESLFYQTIAIDSSKSIREERLKDRKTDFRLIKLFIKEQFSNNKKKEMANFVIKNDNNEELLLKQVKSCIEYLLKIK